MVRAREAHSFVARALLAPPGDYQSDYSLCANATLCEIVFAHIVRRRVKLLGEIHFDVINDYGTISVRGVRRACAKLLVQRKIVAVGDPKGSSTRGYIRMDSPLLWEPDGYVTLVDSLEEAIQQATGVRCASI